MKKKYLNHGFTIIELMVAIVIASLLVVAMYSVYTIQQRSYTVQEQVTEMQQKVRSVMDLMANDIRMAGYDPKNSCSTPGSTSAIISAENQRFTFDVCDPNDPPDGTFHRITYQFVDGNKKSFNLLRSIGRAVPSNATAAITGAETIADGVDAVEFQYLDQNNAPLTPLPLTDANKLLVRSVRVSMLVRSRYPDMKYIDRTSYVPASNQSWPNNAVYPANDHYHRYLLITTIKSRNFGLSQK